MRNHLATDFGEPRQAVGDSDKTLLIESRDIASNVPAIEKGLAGEVIPAQVTLHDIRTADQQHARLADSHLRVEIIGIDPLDGDPGKRIGNSKPLLTAGFGWLEATVQLSAGGEVKTLCHARVTVSVDESDNSWHREGDDWRP